MVGVLLRLFLYFLLFEPWWWRKVCFLFTLGCSFSDSFYFNLSNIYIYIYIYIYLHQSKGHAWEVIIQDSIEGKHIQYEASFRLFGPLPDIMSRFTIEYLVQYPYLVLLVPPWFLDIFVIVTSFLLTEYYL